MLIRFVETEVVFFSANLFFIIPKSRAHFQLCYLVKVRQSNHWDYSNANDKFVRKKHTGQC